MRPVDLLYSALRPLPGGRLGSLHDVRTEAAVVVMTYDDGPEPGSTEGVLEALAARGATATFFMLVGRAEREPGLLGEVAAAGHEIALHGVDHRPLRTFTPTQVRLRTLEGKDRLEQLTGAPVRWFRPPYGGQSIAALRAVRAAGLTSVVWSASLEDFRDGTTHSRLSGVAADLRPGAMVLAHDGFADRRDGVDDGPRPDFDRGDLTRRVLDLLDERGLAACSLGGALATGRPGLRAWFSR